MLNEKRDGGHDLRAGRSLDVHERAERLDVGHPMMMAELADVAEFFSFGTNDLTQMTFGFSRDDAGKFLPLANDIPSGAAWRPAAIGGLGFAGAEADLGLGCFILGRGHELADGVE